MQIDKSKIKVLNIITVFSIGGATETVISSVKGLQDKGYDITILTGPNIESEGDMFDVANKLNLKVIVSNMIKRKISLFHDITALFKISKFIKEGKYDIVHTHSSKAGILGRIAASMAKTPIIIHTIHGLPFHEYQSKKTKVLYVGLEKLGAKFCHKLISVTETIITKSLKENIGNKDQYTVIHSSFDMRPYLRSDYNKVLIRAKYNLSEDDLVIGKIARFSELKGYKYLIDVVPQIIKEVPNAKFLLIGGGEQEAFFKEVIKKQGYEKNVVFTGVIPTEEIPEVISILDIVVHTSLLEGLARVMPQAFASGKPIVSFDIDGAHEVVKHEKTGYLIEPKNSDQLAYYLIKLLKDPAKRKEFGKAGKDLVVCNWSEEKMIDDVDKLYSEMYEKRLK